MKIQQLDFALGGDFRIPISIAAANKEWRQLEVWFREISELSDSQIHQRVVVEGDSDFIRTINTILPSDFVQLVLEQTNLTFFQSLAEDKLYAWAANPELREISAVEVYKKYGGDMIERLLEKRIVDLRKK